ncbi:helix-hairpin-helix domain-containing protein [Aquibacillus salsiterrae]|uniref:Helix-hairpin-helix domain-containing protein n=1 Tax=Aquibacillus salsiterrae TaxID=2950439 RepID=A0A9X4ADR5_9BACI|nr:helix-hairpin-helix domain-containing protein [Aquibacillus salsiterrae]MDC3415584.1 helix-hairpin-helix domain-containing protein [Aquibacillus salsiterrae]
MISVNKSWIIALFAAVIVIISFFDNRNATDSDVVTVSEEAATTQALTQSEESPKVNTTTLYIDVKGEVIKPGVYTVTGETRVADLIELAGGFTTSADMDRVNLAQKVYDEMVIIVPKQGEQGTETFEQPNTTNGKIRINSATKEELAQLNGIGEVKATSIITYREQNGPFQTMEDILKVSGIGEKTLEKFKDQIQVP